MSKREKVLKYLLTGKSLSKAECMAMFSLWNLGGLVHRLRRKYKIKTTMVKCEDGEYARYKMVGE